jgi:hypothetical protein
MSSEAKIVENLGTVSDKLVQYMDAAEQVITQYGGDAVNLGLNVLRIEAGGHIFIGALLSYLSYIFYRIARVGLNATNAQMREDNLFLEKVYESDSETPCVIFGTVGTVVAAIFAGVGLFDIWNWVGIFWPEAYAVHKFLM